MARLRPLPAHEVADPELQATMERLGGDEALGVYAHCPDALKTFLRLVGPLKYGGRLPFALKELVRLRIAELNDCER